MGQFNQVLEKYARYVIQQSRSNLTKRRSNATKRLYNSLEYFIQDTRVTFESEDYGQFIDKGVRGSKSTYRESRRSPFRYKSKQPPSKTITKWAKNRGLKGRDKKTGRFITNKSLSFLIARSIKEKGIRATMFFTKPFEAGLVKYEDLIVNGYLEDNLKFNEE